MIGKRFTIDSDGKYFDRLNNQYLTIDNLLNELNELHEENEKLKQEMGVLLYQIGEAGKNNKTCRECECFIPEHNICYMWDMEVEADDVVMACDQRKVKNWRS